MAITKSATKTIKIEKRRKEENNKTRAKVKDALKSARIAFGSNLTKNELDKKIAKAYRELDLAAKKKFIHKNKASRLKSRLMKKTSK